MCIYIYIYIYIYTWEGKVTFCHSALKRASRAKKLEALVVRKTMLGIFRSFAVS
jgi:hypothetical protein